MKNKKTIAEKLAERQVKIPSKIWWAGYTFLSRLPVFAPKYHPTFNVVDDINEEKGPCFIIWNHLSRRDYLFIKRIVEPKKFNMLAGYPEFFKGHLRPLFNKVEVIPKKEFVQDLVSVKLMNKIIKMGGTISFAPEGTSSIYGCNQPIVPGTGRFLQFYRIPVYFMKLEGAYLSSHKTCTDDHPGKVNASLMKLFSGEDLVKLTPQEIEDKINECFRHDDYAWNKEKRIKFKTKGKGAVNMSSMAYKCPKCGKEMVMRDDNNILYCSECGNGCTINDYYDFVPFNDNCVIPESLSKWVELERRDLILNIRKDKNYSFEFKCEIAELPKYKLMRHNKPAVKCGSGTFRIDHDGIHFSGIRNGKEYKFDLSYNVYYTLIIEEATDIFALFVNDEYIVFYPEDVRCVGKALILTEEMHRLHVNTWKNFTWNNHLYKGTELEVKEK